jgi:polysaccharide pyruvyl transferase WcaK-like protein
MLAKNMTRLAMAEASQVIVRDGTSHKMLQDWHVQASLTADPVWNLEATALPESITQKLQRFKSDNFTVGLSLRTSPNFSEEHFAALIRALHANLPDKTALLLLPLQVNQDQELLLRFQHQWTNLGRTCWLLETDAIERPSQWLNILSQCDLVVGMRLHALILALSSAVPVVGLSYDAKVAHVLTQFEQPILNLTKETPPETVTTQWIETVRMALANTQGLSEIARRHAQGAKEMACQNFQLLDRLLIMQSDPSAGR